MLSVPEVRKAASFADVVKISLSAWDQRSFEWINRPHQKLRFIQILQGQKDFRKQYKNELWMEVFLVQGFNSMPKDVEKIIAHIKEIRPNRIHLNTAVRPPAEDFVKALTKDRMDEIACLFDPPAEVILKEYSAKFSTSLQASEDSILAMLKRRPCTSDQIAKAFGMHINEVSKYLGNLLTANQIRTDRKNNHLFYFAVNKAKATEPQS
jgi:wyosine [tRNA(Phe)-imidazoG37] synthetase (radical SAM superfamily)